MKKSALSLTLLLLVGAGCLTSCNKEGVKPLFKDGKSVLFTIDGKEYTVDDLLSSKLIQSDEGVNQLYKELEKTIIETNVKDNEDIDNAVDIKMGEWKEKVKSYAKENNLTERLAERSLLNQEGFETRNELKESYVLAEKKTKFYKDQQNKYLQPTYKQSGFDSTQFKPDEDPKTLLHDYVLNTNPMVMSHILVKISDTQNAFNSAEITPEESDKLGTVVKRLTMGKDEMNSFSNVAELSQDESNAIKGGNLGIVDEYTSFVDEFKFGVYSSIAYNTKHEINTTFANAEERDAKFNKIVDELNLNKDTFETDGIYESIGEIDVLDAFTALVTKKDDTAKGEQDKDEIDANLFPRNKEFNYAFNTKVASYLTVDYAPEKLAKLTEAFGVSADYAFNTIKVPGNPNKGYVVDENGNPIVVVRSEFGIHFITVTYNSLDHDLVDNMKYFLTKDVEDYTQYFEDKKYNIGNPSETVTSKEKARKKEIEERVMNYAKGGYSSSVSPDDIFFQHKIIKKNIGSVDIPEGSELGEQVITLMNKYLDNKIDTVKDNIEITIEKTVDGYVKKIKADQQGHDLVYKK